MQDKRLRLSLIIGGLVVVALVVASIVAAFTGRPNDAETSDTTAPSASTAASAPSADGDASVCGLTARSDTNDLETTAPETSWDWVDIVFLTSQDETNGPGIVEENGVRYCYARTPTGALLAAYNTVSLAAILPTIAFSEHNVTSGPGLDALLSKPANSEPHRDPSEPMAFRVKAYNETSATIELVVENNERLIAATFELRWELGDWRIVPLTSGQVYMDRSLVTSIAGYVPWGPRA